MPPGGVTCNFASTPQKDRPFRSWPMMISVRRFGSGSSRSERRLLPPSISPGCAKLRYIAFRWQWRICRHLPGSAIRRAPSSIFPPSVPGSSKMSRGFTFRIGVDTGGTFTDFVVIRDGRIEVFKELSTPQRPDDAIMKGLAGIEQTGIEEVIHGSTVATNALLERKGARTALVATEGFEDVLVIGRQTRR